MGRASHAGNGERRVEADSGKRKKESLPGASARIPVGISVATLFYVRGICLGDDNGDGRGGRGRVRGRMAKSQRQTATSFSPPMPPDKSDCVRRRPPLPHAHARARARGHSRDT